MRQDIKERSEKMGKNYNGTQINQSVSIVEKAGMDIDDARNRVMKYDEDGNVVPAEAGTDIPLGVAIIETGYNDISGGNSGKVKKGEDIDIQIKDIGYAIAGADIKKGQEVTAGTGGTVSPATGGNYVLGIALCNAGKGAYCRIQIVKYQKAAASGGTSTD
ncbi:hypothetical protein BRYFOR_07611 [Marvinbryantia formatexigens DSM 14469]|uniref:Uncharacterized protein n=2 Tax=Marvinbryantia TaxID=248744 RepID=C6LG51_9FIRM|nr:hypothetical protein BRYFOR_07611 [Marvinbryantia formatexigens DSM 14469]